MSYAYFWKIRKAGLCDVFQSVKSDVTAVGSFTGSNVRPTQTPWEEYSMYLFVLSTRVEMAVQRGCCRPNPPLFIDMLLINIAWSGMDERPVTSDRKLLVIFVNSSLILLRQRCQLLGRLAIFSVTTSDA